MTVTLLPTYQGSSSAVGYSGALLPTEPVPTPAPSPTRQAHLVEAGDTLAGIAYRYGVPLESLMLANPGVEPALLQIGQPIVIPALDRRALLDGLATPTPMPLEIAGTALYRGPADHPWLLGEVFNPSATPVENVQLTAVLQDANGAPLAQLRTWTAVDQILPNNSSPFAFRFDESPANSVDQFEILVLSAQPAARLENGSASLSLVESNGRLDGSSFRIEVTITSLETEVAAEFTIVATLRDSLGAVTGFRVYCDSGPLAPLATAAYAFDVVPVAPGTTAYDLVMYGTLRVP